jgi:PTS system N-acetylglucosamine-specific IIC component
MAGFFPVMMFGLPAACLAMYRNALPERRKAVGGLLLSLALTSLLTGVTEPIEFGFIFLAPLLYLIHAVLTGIAMVVMDALGVKLGFGFSAGLFDYVLNFGLSTRPLLLIPVGIVYFAIYYFTFSWCIRRFDLKTPGREVEAVAVPDTVAGGRGAAMVAALGGAGNIRSTDACMTRLRLVVVDQERVDEAQLRGLGARGVLRLRDGGLQVVLGPVADQVAGEIRAALHAGPAAVPVPATAGPDVDRLEQLLRAAGARGIATNATRVLVDVAQAADAAALRAAGVRAVVEPSGAGQLHLILGPSSGEIAEQLQARLFAPA